MEKSIYIQLLGEGTKVYRPVPSFEIEENIYKVGGFEIYNPGDENWEFLPGTHVIVEERNLSNGNVLVAIKEQGGKENDC